MAVMQNSLIFGDVNSADYGIYISGEGVFNAPKRDVEMINIPGRNGAFALDKGRFENITVTYPAITFVPGDYDTFARNLADFRNAICLLRGYQRLTDTFHPEEYRMATYIGGLEIKPIKHNTASQFDIVFDCKPQRYLMSGEAAVDVSDGDTLMNPTMFESSPLIMADGYGAINFNEYTINIEDIIVGDVPIASQQTVNNNNVSVEYDDKAATFSSGDQITMKNIVLRSSMTITTSAYYVQEAGQDDRPMGIIYWNSPNTDATLGYSCSGKVVSFSMTIPEITLTVGTNLKRTYSTRATVKVEVNTGGGTQWQRQSWYATTVIDYKNGKIKITAERIFLDDGELNYAWPITQNSISIGAINGYSTTRIEVGTKYIDCDLGEAYLLDGDTSVNLNQHIDLGSDLPKLASGPNTITCDNTITDLKILPRWWKV